MIYLSKYLLYRIPSILLLDEVLCEDNRLIGINGGAVCTNPVGEIGIEVKGNATDNNFDTPPARMVPNELNQIMCLRQVVGHGHRDP